MELTDLTTTDITQKWLAQLQGEMAYYTSQLWCELGDYILKGWGSVLHDAVYAFKDHYMRLSFL